MSSISSRLDCDPEPWKPEAGDRLIGTVVEVVTRTSEWGLFPCATVLTDDGHERTWHAWHTVPRNEIRDRGLRPRDRVGVLYRGLQQSGDGNPWHDYRIVIEAHAESAPPAEPEPF